MQDEKRTRGMEFIALSLLAESSEPVGSPRLVTALQDAGIEVAEATAGRYLRSLDGRGLTTRIGRQGRRITDRGRQRLQHVKLVERMDEQSSELVRLLREQDALQLIDILMLRRAVECEAARLAAMRANDQECRRLREIADLHVHHVAGEEDGKRHAVNFHLEVARASHSPLIRTTIELLIEPANDPVMNLLDVLTLEHGAQHAFSAEHRAVADAIAQHDPVAAESAMRVHMDALIALVERALDRSP